MFPEARLLQTNLLTCFLESEEIDQEIKKKILSAAIEKTRVSLSIQNHVNTGMGGDIKSAINDGRGILDGLSQEQILNLKARSMGY